MKLERGDKFLQLRACDAPINFLFLELLSNLCTAELHKYEVAGNITSTSRFLGMKTCDVLQIILSSSG